MKEDSSELYFIDVSHKPLHGAVIRFRFGNHHKELSDPFIVTHLIKHRINPMIHFCLIDVTVHIRNSLCFGR